MIKDSLNKYKDLIEFAVKNKYQIKINYTDEINYDNNDIVWKYPPYYVKNFMIDKILIEINNYFNNHNNMLIIMYFENSEFTHKIPLNLPNEKIE
tara:strand:+ start:201 stop:485 length:285 start_codon:yes stop_codon:yes gene_type:complete